MTLAQERLLEISEALLIRLELELKESNNHQIAGGALLPDLREIIAVVRSEQSSKEASDETV